MLNLIGQVAPSKGLAQQEDHLGRPAPFVARANAYMKHQRSPLPLYYRHDFAFGTVEILARSADDGLMMMATLGDDWLPFLEEHQPWFVSPSIRAVPTGAGGMTRELIRLDEISLTSTPAYSMTANHRVRWSPDDGCPPVPLSWRRVWKDGLAVMAERKYRRAPERLEIHDYDELPLRDAVYTDPERYPSPTIRHRSDPGVTFEGKDLPPAMARRVDEFMQVAEFAGMPQSQALRLLGDVLSP